MNIRKNALVVGALIILTTWILMGVGAFRITDGLVYTSFVRFYPLSANPTSTVLIVKSGFNRLGAGDDVWLTLLRELKRQGAKQVVFTFFPSHASRQFYEEAAANSSVIFGREFSEDGSVSPTRQLEPLPVNAANLTIPFGILVDPPDEFGMHLYQLTKVAADGSSYPSLEAAAAGNFRGTGISRPSILINFLGKGGGIPHVSLERALKGGLIPELVKGKSVIIGFSDPAHEPLLRTPLGEGRDISLLDYRAFALDTLIADKAIAEIPLFVRVLFIALIVFTGLLLHTLLEIRFIIWLTLATTTVFIGASWLLLVFGQIWFPVTESLMAFLLTFLLIFRQRVLLSEQAVNDMALNLSAKLKQRVMHESFYSSNEHWSQVITMVNQTLSLTRAIFLEKMPGDHRVREVKSLNCSINDISELRRDYERDPYKTAIDRGGPIRIELANYLSKHETAEDQYLVPLIFGGNPLGFWAFGISPENAAKIPSFEGTIRDFGKQIGELLFRRQEWQAQDQQKNSFAGNYLDLSRNIPHEELRNFIDLFEARVNTLETVFSELGTATILYDLFGRVLMVNRRMVEIMKDAGLAPYEMTALDLAATLTGLPVDEIRGHFQRVLLEHREISLATHRIQAGEDTYLLRIKPLTESKQTLTIAEASPFSIYGILFELIDLSDVARQEQSRNRLVGSLAGRLSELLAPTTATFDKLADETITPETRQTLIRGLNGKSTEMIALANYIGQSLKDDPSMLHRERYPVDGLHLLRVAASQAERDLVNLRINTAIIDSGDLPFVWGSPGPLREAFHAFIVMLGKDAIRDTSIRINYSDEGDQLLFRFASSGFGMPTTVLQRSLFSDEPTDSIEHRRARAAIQYVQQSQGTVDATSEVGTGINVDVRLKKFI